MNVLNSKLMIPKRRDVLHRQRLTRLFKDNIDKKLFVVTAGAGFGKTTLVIDALNHMDIKPVWYRLDEQDTDFQVFMSYLYSAVDQQFGGGRQAENRGPFGLSGIKHQTAVLLEWLSFVQKQVQQQAVIILDDYHLVQHSPSVNSAVDFILQRLPDHIQMIIIGRKRLPLGLSRLRVQEKLVEIAQEELCFSDREIKQFFDRRLDITQPNVEQILETTNGWVASLVLLRYSFSKTLSTTITESLAKLIKRPEMLFAYLKENVFDFQPAHIREFMMKAALLPEIDSQRCRAIFDVEHADRIMGRMLEDHLMIFPVDDSETVFRLHHLFRDFLLVQLHEHFRADDIARLHCRIAEAYTSHDIYLALEHFIEGRDYDRALQIIEANELEFLLRGRVHFLERCLNRVPEAVVEENPKLLLSQARICSHFGDPEKAIELTSRSLKLFQHRNAKEQMVDCFIELGMQYYYTGHLKEAKLLMEQVLDSIEHDSPAYIICMTFLTFLPAVLGEFDASSNYARDARKNISHYPEFKRKVATVLLDTSLTHTLYFSGEFEYSQQVSERLLKRVLQMNLEPCQPLIYYQLSTNCYFLGQWKTGCDWAQKGISVCDRMSLADGRTAWVYLAWAQNLFGLGQYEDAGEKLDRSIQLFESPGNRWGLASAWDCLAAFYLEQGKSGPALRILESALDLIKGYGLKVTRAILENSYARVLQAEDKLSSSLRHLALARPNLAGVSYHLFNNHLLCARAYYGIDEPVKSAAHLSDALTLSKAYSFSRFIIENRDWILPLLTLSNNKQVALSSELQSYAAEVFQVEAAKEPPVLNVSLLGKFQLCIGERQLPSSSWKSSKALMIFKYLTSNGNHGFIPKDFLIELLWPEQNPAKTGSRFNMAMSSLRKTLEPELPPKAPCAYIDRKKDTYRIFKDRFHVDVQKFSTLFSEAKKAPPGSDKALGLYLEACELYRGEFLEEDRYEQWCEEIRQNLSRHYLDMLQSIISIFENRKDFKKAILYAHKLLDTAPLSEDVLIKLMQFYSKSGAVSKIITAYETYATHAAKLDCPVSDEISALFKNLVKI